MLFYVPQTIHVPQTIVYVWQTVVYVPQIIYVMPNNLWTSNFLYRNKKTRNGVNQYRLYITIKIVTTSVRGPGEILCALREMCPQVQSSAKQGVSGDPCFSGPTRKPV